MRFLAEKNTALPHDEYSLNYFNDLVKTGLNWIPLLIKSCWHITQCFIFSDELIFFAISFVHFNQLKDFVSAKTMVFN